MATIEDEKLGLHINCLREVVGSLEGQAILQSLEDERHLLTESVLTGLVLALLNKLLDAFLDELKKKLEQKAAELGKQATDTLWSKVNAWLSHRKDQPPTKGLPEGADPSDCAEVDRKIRDIVADAKVKPLGAAFLKSGVDGLTDALVGYGFPQALARQRADIFVRKVLERANP